ncbi:MAG: PspA/IM30 family protein [Nitrospinae bacterium]|nr:PspA/IM30 family protein [Nitrospinota bacterium]
MAGFFSRIFKMGQAEAHNALDSLEDPIKLSEQAIRDLKKDLTKSMQSLAEVKANAIRLKKDADNNKSRAAEYERKAMLLLQKGESGDKDQMERLAIEAINEKEKFQKLALTNSHELQNHEKMLTQLQGSVDKLKNSIKSYENDLVLLKTRSRTALATKKLNKQLSSVDSSSTIALLERMKNKVEEDEALAEAYGGLIDAESSIDSEIDKALLSGSTEVDAGRDKIAELKAKMGMT